MELAMKSLFEPEPMKSYRDYFTVHLVLRRVEEAAVERDSERLCVENDNERWQS